MDMKFIDRTPEYWEALQKRLGFDVLVEPAPGQAKVIPPNVFLVHCSGVSFRREVLEKAKLLCSYEHTPAVSIRREKPEEQVGYDDPDAIRVDIGTSRDDVTGDWNLEHAGYLPKRRCPACATSMPGKRAEKLMCINDDCELDFEGLTEQISRINTWVGAAIDRGDSVLVGLDNVTENQTKRGTNLGLDIWVRVDSVK